MECGGGRVDAREGQAEGGGGGGARGGGASQRRPALRQPSERGNCTRDTHVPAGGGWGGREGGTRRLGGNSAPPPPARRGRQHGRGSRARGPRGLSFPSRLAHPRGTTRARPPLQGPGRAPGAPRSAPTRRVPGPPQLPAGSLHTMPHRESHSIPRGNLEGYVRPAHYTRLTPLAPALCSR